MDSTVQIYAAITVLQWSVSNYRCGHQTGHVSKHCHSYLL